nr:MAG TPA: Putative TetR-family transcriptional regulator [Caudoviricetes sp.]
MLLYCLKSQATFYYHFMLCLSVLFLVFLTP